MLAGPQPLAARTIALSPTGREAVSQSSLGFAIWDLAGSRDVHIQRGYRTPSAAFSKSLDIAGVAYSPDGRIIAVWGRGRIMLWDIQRREPVWPPSSHAGAVHHVAVSSDGRFALSVSRDDYTVRTWTVAGGEAKVTWPAEAAGAYFSPNGGRVLVAEGRGLYRPGGASTHMRDSSTGTVLWEAAGRQPEAPAHISPDGKLVATFGQRGGLSLHDADTGRPVWNAGHGLSPGQVPCLAFTADSKRVLATRPKGGIEIWDVDRRRVVGEVGGNQAIQAIALAGTTVFVAGRDLEAVDLATGGLRWRSPIVTMELTTTPGGERVVARGADGKVRLLDAASGRDLGAIDLSGARDRAQSIAVTPDGRLLLIGTERGVVLKVALAPVRSQP